ncbi:hypothetical protein [Cohnella abietis]|uniref:hypothetical protein n=1 Tax=Cohnella abietis TaxID=2507935 RepID=UPI00102EC7DF|nr:hypothetical protein [Cohnella abietis]
MNKYIYLSLIILLHAGWLFWLIHDTQWHRNIHDHIENLSPGAIASIPTEYKLSKGLFYGFTFGIIMIHGLFIGKSKCKPLTKLLIEIISILFLPILIFALLLIDTV